MEAKIDIRLCPGCNNEFKPSSNHKLCPKCRNKKYRGNCLDCGKAIQKRSSRCHSCHNKNNGLNSKWVRPTGYRYNRNGYVMVKCSGHPRLKRSSGAGNYVFEHVLVMEKKIGRYLEQGENVHHINGIRDDNREENLELWVRPQPSGIRARDAVAWAKEILKKYGDLY